MELTNEFRVGVPVDQAWAVLTDVERIAPCLPGAQLQEIEGDQYRGLVKVKVGPITAQYKGVATFTEKDDAGHRAVLRAEGRDTRGQGNANATITATLVADGDATSVKVVTDLTITGKVAQFGRGVLADVSGKLIDQFVENLERGVLGGEPSAPAPAAAAPTPAPTTAAPGLTGSESPSATAAASSAVAIAEEVLSSNGVTGGVPASAHGTDVGASAGIRTINGPSAKPVDLLSTAGTPVIKRLIPAAGALLVLVLLWRLIHRRED